MRETATGSLADRSRDWLVKYGFIAVTVALVVWLALSEERFRQSNTIFSMLKFSSSVAIAGLGITVTMVVGGLDLSVHDEVRDVEVRVGPHLRLQALRLQVQHVGVHRLDEVEVAGLVCDLRGLRVRDDLELDLLKNGLRAVVAAVGNDRHRIAGVSERALV